MGGLTLQRQKSQPINFGITAAPREGGRAFMATFDFTGTPIIPMSAAMEDFGMSMLQTLYIDNSNNNSSAIFQVGGTNQRVICPPATQGYFPCLFVGSTINIQAQSAGNVPVIVYFLNTFVDPMLWSASNPIISGTVTVNGTTTAAPQTGVYTGRSGSIAAAGVSQNLAPANGARKRLFIQNPATPTGQNIAAAESLYIDFTTAAGVNNGVSIELQPGQTFDTGQGPITTEAVTVVAATVNHRFIARELN